jgi:glycosyltransferase involved in cell wall biosynthesis
MLLAQGVDVHVTWSGAIHRHPHLTPPGRRLRALQPDVVLVDEELFSVPAARWVHAASRAGVPVAVRAWENLDRPLPWPAHALRTRTLRRASGLLARTPAAARLARRSGATGTIELVPSPIGAPTTVAPFREDASLTIGYVGRLVDAMGVRDLLAAIDRLPAETRLLVAGDGPLGAELAAHPKVDLRTGVPKGGMGAVYDAIDVLVLPSRTTRTSVEEPGRVLLEGMAHGRPVIGADSGDIPWVLSEARGGVTFPEGDVLVLAGLLADVRADPTRWRALGARGRADVIERFSVDASKVAVTQLVERLVGEAAAAR